MKRIENLGTQISRNYLRLIIGGLAFSKCTATCYLSKGSYTVTCSGAGGCTAEDGVGCESSTEKEDCMPDFPAV